MTIHDQLSRLQQIMKLPASEELMAEVEKICSNEIACKVFWCERLENVDWLRLMIERKWFANVPNIVREGNAIVHPAWPESNILLRFAKRVPTEVASVLASIPESDNPRVGDQIIRIAAELGNVQDIQLVRERIGKILVDRTRSAWLWLVELLRHWLDAGAAREVLQLLPQIFIVETGEKESAGQESWELRRLDEKILVPLSASHGMEVVTILCATLDASNSSTAEEQFGSALWLEDLLHNPGFTHQPETILILRIYAICRDIITREGTTGAIRVDHLLRPRKWHLFRRLRWQLYADFPQHYLDQARGDVLERIKEMNRIPHGFELQNMIATFVAKYGDQFLSPDEISVVIESISGGPLDADGKIDSDELYVNRFRAKQIQPFRPLIPDKNLFAVKTPGGDEVVFDSEDYKPFRSLGEARVIEQRSPITPEQLANMDDAKLWPLLNEWAPDSKHLNAEWWIEEGVAGLANAFAKAIAYNRSRFNASSEWWKHLRRPAFLWRILDTTLSDDKALQPTRDDWETWIGLCEYVVAQQPIEQPDSDGKTDDTSVINPTWKYARWSVARLIDRMLQREDSPPAAYAPRIAKLLQTLASEDDPRLDEIDRSWSSSSFDWLSKGINTSAGTAIEALLLFSMWQRKDTQEATSIRWVTDLLSEQLAKENQSPAIFAVLGSRLVLLVHLFPDWCRDQGEAVFPFQTRLEHARAALISHLGYNNPHHLVLEGFPNLPDQALELIDFNEDEDRTASRVEMPFRLGYHLSYYYWNALPSETIADRRLDKFFEVASAGTRGRLIAEIGHVFRRASSSSSSAALINRAQKLWDKRFATISEEIIRNQDSRDNFLSELESFAQWVEADCFDSHWRLMRFAESLELLPRSPEVLDLAKTLENLSERPENLQAVMRCVQLLTAKFSDRLRWSMGEDDLKETIKRGLKAADSETRRLADSARDNLLRNCLFAYQDLE